MDDYKPLDLSAWCNTGSEVLGDGKGVDIGRQTLRGLPYPGRARRRR